MELREQNGLRQFCKGLLSGRLQCVPSRGKVSRLRHVATQFRALCHYSSSCSYCCFFLALVLVCLLVLVLALLLVAKLGIYRRFGT